jgi:hypothetical protein
MEYGKVVGFYRSVLAKWWIPVFIAIQKQI